MRFRSIVFISFLSLALVSCDQQMKKSADLSTHEAQLSYAIGRQIGDSLKNRKEEVNVDALALAITDALNDVEPRVTQEQQNEAMSKSREMEMLRRQEEAKKNLDEANEFLTKNKSKEGVESTESGLQYQVLTPGKGDSPKESDRVKVHYTGTLLDGTKFDSSVDRGQPAVFGVGQVIPGWTEALQKMKVGGRWKLFIPPNLAYGERARPSIPGNSLLVFEVELLEIVKS